MKSLMLGLGLFITTLVFVNVMLFGILGINASSLSTKTLLIVEGVFCGFFIFIYLIVAKKF
ncbi:hypothetical protein GYA37_03325 [candidate division WWE3 bacterium]|uniref:Uncharacterized protein n=1 Tax=candidate division WWE3 bacterium TaxID=2053526 RepID=A0A7X9HT50_UNCKA|nr:hypothetical protein [candidate division WWE3 bacterium]